MASLRQRALKVENSRIVRVTPRARPTRIATAMNRMKVRMTIVRMITE